jgi:hypothetical protein
MRVCWTILLAELAACGFNPQPRGGALPCDNGCPSGYYCAKDGTCWQNGSGPDASSPGGSQSSDAPVVSVPPLDAGLPGGNDAGPSPIEAGATPDVPVSTGGVVGTGGFRASGGQTGSGGIAGTGGLASTGAASGSGGVVDAGGIVGTGGTTGAGGGSAVGTLSVLAGVPSGEGNADGTGAAARFQAPQGVAVDGAGNVFVADTYNNAIRRITISAAVSTVVGVADPTKMGNFPGPLPASMALPLGVAVDPSTGNLCIVLEDAVMVAVLPK